MRTKTIAFGSLLGLALAIAGLLLYPPRARSAEATFVRGDVDETRTRTVTDAVRILYHLFGGSEWQLSCEDAADVDDSGTLGINDAIQLLDFLFRGGAEPPAPFSDCGSDPTEDDLRCAVNYECFPAFAGVPIEDAGGIFWVVDKSWSMRDSGELDIAKREIIRVLLHFPPETEFGIVLFDSSVVKFPQSGQPARADQESKDSATNFVMSIAGSSGSCVRAGMTAALAMANESTATKRIIFYLGDGGGTCEGSDEMVYLEETLAAVREMNTQGVIIHTIGVLSPSTIGKHFLEALAEENGGTYTEIVR